MKNFLSITGIDTSSSLQVAISIVEHNDPEYTLTLNKILIKDSSTVSLDLLDSIDLTCLITKGAVEIKMLVNNKEILPIYQHLAHPATTWITTNWNFYIPGPFYPWYHQITGQGWIA